MNKTPDALRRAIESSAGKDRGPKPPKGWEPRLDTDEGVICYVTEEPVESHDWRTIVQFFGFDPDLFTIDPTTLRASAWEQQSNAHGRTVLHAYKADIKVRSAPLPEFDCVHKRLSRVRNKRTSNIQSPDSTWVFTVSDVQLGKIDSYGPDGEHAHRGVDLVLDRLAELPAMFSEGWRNIRDRQPQEIALVFPGDNIEQCGGSYAAQSYLTGLNVVEQRELIADAFDVLIDKATQLGLPVKVIAVGGNHGENKAGGSFKGTSRAKTVTDYADNDDVAIFRSLKRAYDKSGKYDNLEWYLPHHELDQVVNLSGTLLAVTHGHLFQNPSSAFKWWTDQMLGRLPAGQAHILLSGHYHHFRIDYPTEGRIWVQAPALESGSHYFRNATGKWHSSGQVLTFLTAKGRLDALSLLKASQ